MKPLALRVSRRRRRGARGSRSVVGKPPSQTLAADVDSGGGIDERGDPGPGGAFVAVFPYPGIELEGASHLTGDDGSELAGRHGSNRHGRLRYTSCQRLGKCWGVESVPTPCHGNPNGTDSTN